MPLTVKQIAALIKVGSPGMHAVGGGLYLRTDATRSNWLFRFTSPITKARREMGLGSTDLVSLAEARQRAAEAGRLVVQGLDPIEEAKRPAARPADAAPTFGQAMEDFLTTKAPEWSNAKHADQWRSTLERYASSIMTLPVDDIRPRDVAALLGPIWLSKVETARRIRGRIEAIITYAEALGHDTRAPAALARVQKLLPKQRRKVEHHAAVELDKAQDVFAAIWTAPGMGAAALRMTILGAFRSGEVRAMRWDYIDTKERLITLPEGVMKARRAHRVPMSSAMRSIIENHKRIGRSGLVFPSNTNKPLSDMSLAAVHKRIGIDATVHGWRSVFRVWAREIEKAPDDVAELSLAHTIGTDTTRAYLRSDLLKERRPLMQAWADWICAKIEQ